MTAPDVRDPGGVLLLATYELGRPPASTARMAAHLEAAGFSPHAVDLSRDTLETEAVERAALAVVATPMHTALRLALEILPRLSGLPVCFAGHYAMLHAEHLLELGVGAVLGGELEGELVALAKAIEAGDGLSGLVARPLRRLPVVATNGASGDLSKYAHYVDAAGKHHLAGYIEATRGCLDHCRHCPIPPVYGGKFIAVDTGEVLGSIERQVDAGAVHVSFGDPDFLNGPTHSLRICRELHRRWPQLTFDFTSQVSHILENRVAVTELVELGATFAVSAVESLSNAVLAAIGKRHRRADVDAMLDWIGEIGLPVRPTFVPFTPWTELGDLVELTDWIADRGLAASVDPVQLSVRLLVPPGSLMLDAHPHMFGPFDPALLSHAWHSPLDPLARELAGIAADGGDHAALSAAVRRAAGLPMRASIAPDRPAPRISEPWFC